MKSEDINLKKELANCKTMDDLCGKNRLLQRLLGDMVEQMLDKEMEAHLGYKKRSAKGYHSGNSRNGKNSKKVLSSYGPIEREVPRDCDCQFEPHVLKKRQHHISAFEDKIISMYARGMSTRDIQNHV